MVGVGEALGVKVWEGRAVELGGMVCVKVGVKVVAWVDALVGRGGSGVYVALAVMSSVSVSAGVEVRTLQLVGINRIKR